MKKKKIGLIITGFLIFFAASLVILFEFTGSPQFCNTCHIMKPYYDSWKASRHNKVSCVDCHYPPSGPGDFLWKKFQATSQVVKYVTRTYGTKPVAEVEDSACLRQGCHAKRLVEGKLIFGKGIKFDHRPHLAEPRRGRQLRCTSCHSQIMVGKHLEVTLDTCYLCHFKGMRDGRGFQPIGGCVSCHTLPDKDFICGNIKYNHKDFAAKRNVECQNCHMDAIQGDGSAPKERCYTCHNQPDRLEKYGDKVFIHDNHITKHGVACFHCHSEMTHSIQSACPKNTGLDCAICHNDTHSGQKDMYEGRGGKGAADMPSPMNLVRVDCPACHNIEERGLRPQGTSGEAAFRASGKGCVKCHGEKYEGLVGDMKKAVDLALKAIEPRLKKAKDILSENPPDASNSNRLKQLYDEAAYNYNFVRSSTGIHNIYYSAKLLARANDDLENFQKESKRELPILEKAELLDANYCATLCHSKLDIKLPEEVKYKGRDMPHSMHVEEVGACANCHELGGHKEGPLKPDLDICPKCHEGAI